MIPNTPDFIGPNLRLAHIPGTAGDNPLRGARGHTKLPLDEAPGLLVSYAYLRGWDGKQENFVYTDWMLDSGAFSAHNRGTKLDLDAYIGVCKRLMATDPTLAEIIALDVVGDWRATVRNAEKMWAAGIPAIPTYHYSEPEDVLRGFGRDYPKVAIGGMSILRGSTKREWAEQCFARLWPKAIHGFGVTDVRICTSLPWSSVDSATWCLRPCRYGQWRSFGSNKKPVAIRGASHNLRPEIAWYAKLERQMRAHWHEELEKLDYRSHVWNTP